MNLAASILQAGCQEGCVKWAWTWCCVVAWLSVTHRKKMIFYHKPILQISQSIRNNCLNAFSSASKPTKTILTCINREVLWEYPWTSNVLKREVINLIFRIRRRCLWCVLNIGFVLKVICFLFILPQNCVSYLTSVCLELYTLYCKFCTIPTIETALKFTLKDFFS